MKDNDGRGPTLEELKHWEIEAEDLAAELEGTAQYDAAVALFHSLLHARMRMILGVAAVPRD